MRKILLLLLLLLALAGAACAAEAAPQAAAEAPAEQPGAAAEQSPAEEPSDPHWFADLSSVDLAGNAVDVSVFGDHDYTLIVTWATWCSNCIRELEFMEELYQQYREQGLNIVGLMVDFNSITGLASEEEQQEAADIVAELGLTFPQLVDFSSLLDSDFIYINSVPRHYIVDSAGRMAAPEIVGGRSQQVWAELFDELVAEAQQ